jgi:hypothetical protein
MLEVGEEASDTPENVLRAAAKLQSTMICSRTIRRSLNAPRSAAKYALSWSKLKSPPGPWKT